MKQFLYLDTDIITSIIAQAEKGYITQTTSENDRVDERTKEKGANANISASGEGKFLWFAKANAEASLAAEITGGSRVQTTSREIVEKILHDAAFDIAMNYINPAVVALNNQDYYEEGNYIELKRVFDFIDFDYIERMFEEGGIIDYVKKEAADKIEQEFAQKIENGLNREQKRQGGNTIKNEIKKAKEQSDQKYDNAAMVIKMFRSVIPYDRVLLSSDGYLVPLDDKYFRVNPKDIGFKYGGEMNCVGMVTNIIGASTNSEDGNVFKLLQFTANETLRAVLPTNNSDLCVIHPIAVYYG